MQCRNKKINIKDRIDKMFESSLKHSTANAFAGITFRSSLRTSIWLVLQIASDIIAIRHSRFITSASIHSQNEFHSRNVFSDNETAFRLRRHKIQRIVFIPFKRFAREICVRKIFYYCRASISLNIQQAGFVCSKLQYSIKYSRIYRTRVGVYL